MMTKTGLNESLVTIPAGTLICDVIQDGCREPEAAFLLKDKQTNLNLILKNQVNIEFRCNHIALDDVLFVPFAEAVQHRYVGHKYSCSYDEKPT